MFGVFYGINAIICLIRPHVPGQSEEIHSISLIPNDSIRNVGLIMTDKLTKSSDFSHLDLEGGKVPFTDIATRISIHLPASAPASISLICMLPTFTMRSRRHSPAQPSSVLLNTALLLWAFNIKEDPSSPIDTTAFRRSLITSPLPFSVIFEPRAAESAEGIQELLNDYAL